MKKNKFPKGWNEKRVNKVLKHYEKQTQEQAVAEDEAALKRKNETLVPSELVPAILEMISKHKP